MAKLSAKRETVALPVMLASGETLTEELLDELVAEAEAGYADAAIAWRRGRPSLDQLVAGVSPTLNFRITQRLHDAVQARAAAEGVSVSDIGRAALERYVRSKPRRRSPGRVPVPADELGA